MFSNMEEGRQIIPIEHAVSNWITFISAQPNLNIETVTPMDVFSSDSLSTMQRNASANLLVKKPI